MFHGSIPADMRSIVHEHVRLWDNATDVWVGCSGNFTVERTIWPLNKRLHSNDVTAYPSALGWWFQDHAVPFTVKPEYEEDLEWVMPYMETEIGKMAVLMLGTTFLSLVGSEKNYQRRLLSAYQQQFPQLFDKTVARLESLDMRVESFHAMDVNEWVETVVPKDAPVVMYPPFFARDYEQQFEPLDHFFDWPRPTYPDLDEERKDALVEMVKDRDQWVIGLHIEREDLRPYLTGRVQTSNRGVPINVYSSRGGTRIVQPRQQVEFISTPKIGFNDDVTGPLGLSILSGGQFQAIRSQFMSKTIKPGQPLLTVGVTAGDKLIGAFAYAAQRAISGPKDVVYLLSDFPVSWSKYKNLAKLIVMAAMSKEAQTLIQRTLSRKITGVETTAFSNRPVSMKYRGPMKLKSRKDGDDGYHKYKLQYEATMGEWTLEEALTKWLDGPGKTLKPGHMEAKEKDRG